MKFIQGYNRLQMVLIPECLDSLIGDIGEVRMIARFADTLGLAGDVFYFQNPLLSPDRSG